MSSRSRQQLEEWLKGIRPKGSILDIGGSQNPVLKRTGFVDLGAPTNYKIMDLEYPHEDTPAPDIVLDINYPVGSKNHPTFDTVFCIEVMEYVFDPVTALRNIADYMNEGGTLYISFHWLYPYHKPLGEDCLRYSRWGIIKLMDAAGLEIVEIKDRDISLEGEEHLHRFFTAEKMRGAYDEDEVWEQGYLVTAKKR